MTDRLIRTWSWVAGHRLAAGWGAVLLALVLLGGGLGLGAAWDARPDFQPPIAEAEETAFVRPASTAVEAVIMGRRPNGFVARTRAGDLLLIRTSPQTTYRLRGRPAEAAAVRRGAIVVVLGRPDAVERAINARAIAVRGQIRPPALPPEAIGLP
jgi:hypothetical protein